MPLIVLALIVVPLVEIYLLIQVGQLIGPLPTVVLLLAMSVLGGYLLTREGSRTWRAFQSALKSGRVPAVEVADGALVILGAALLLTPGFFTDAVGLLCLLPGSRTVLRRMLTGLVARRFGAAGIAGAVAADRLGRPRSRPEGSYDQAVRRGQGEVVDGEVADGPDPDDPRRPSS